MTDLSYFLFNLTSPAPYFENGPGVIHIPKKYSVTCGIGWYIFPTLKDHDVFFSLPISFQKHLIILLSIVLNDVYSVARFQQPCAKVTSHDDESFVDILICLLEKIRTRNNTEELSLAEQITKLVGIVGIAGTTSDNLNDLLKLFHSWNELHQCFLECLVSLMKVPSSHILKAYPDAFFSFGEDGRGAQSGLFLTLSAANALPALREYEIILRFRIEMMDEFKVECKTETSIKFSDSTMRGDSGLNVSGNESKNGLLNGSFNLSPYTSPSAVSSKNGPTRSGTSGPTHSGTSGLYPSLVRVFDGITREGT